MTMTKKMMTRNAFHEKTTPQVGIKGILDEIRLRLILPGKQFC